MTTVIESRPREGETWAEFQARKREEMIEARKKRTERELFRLALVALRLDRYVFGVEHGLDPRDAAWRVHAYVACKECYQNRAGIVESRTLVANSAIREELDPDNEVLSVGANMLNVINSMMDHEQKFHGGRPR